MTARREALVGIMPPSGDDLHAGLWLDKYFEDHDDSDAKRRLVDQVAKAAPSELYRRAYERWRDSLPQLTPLASEDTILRFGIASVKGRMVVGLGAEGVIENTIALQRSYGVPLIPGSALKGLAASYAHRRLAEEGWHKPMKHDERWTEAERAEEERRSSRHRVLFGDTADAGFITFFDAWFVPPARGGTGMLQPDVLTVHHQEYYGDKGMPPADWDNPIPAPFLSATGEYLIALVGPRAWVNTAFDILTWALLDEGIGAKTESGYGRLVLRTEAEHRLGFIPASDATDVVAVGQ